MHVCIITCDIYLHFRSKQATSFITDCYGILSNNLVTVMYYLQPSPTLSRIQLFTFHGVKTSGYQTTLLPWVLGLLQLLEQKNILKHAGKKLTGQNLFICYLHLHVWIVLGFFLFIEFRI